MEGLTTDERLYADDTICVTKTGAAMNRLVSEIQTEGERYGLKLNLKKCEYICFGNPARITYQNKENPT